MKLWGRMRITQLKAPSTNQLLEMLTHVLSQPAFPISPSTLQTGHCVLEVLLLGLFLINPLKCFQIALSQTNLEMKECRCQTCMKPIQTTEKYDTYQSTAHAFSRILRCKLSKQKTSSSRLRRMGCLSPSSDVSSVYISRGESVSSIIQTLFVALQGL